jgi:hypothetical protein
MGRVALKQSWATITGTLFHEKTGWPRMHPKEKRLSMYLEGVEAYGPCNIEHPPRWYGVVV